MAIIAYRVTGAGSLNVNGDYLPYGYSNGVGSFKNQNGVFLYRVEPMNKVWYFDKSGDASIASYYIESTSNTPPLTGYNNDWANTFGIAPFPAVTAFRLSTRGDKELRNSYDALTSSDATKYIGHETTLKYEQTFVPARSKVGI